MRDIPQLEQNEMATFADDTAVMSEGDTVQHASKKLQRTISKVSS